MHFCQSFRCNRLFAVILMWFLYQTLRPLSLETIENREPSLNSLFLWFVRILILSLLWNMLLLQRHCKQLLEYEWISVITFWGSKDHPGSFELFLAIFVKSSMHAFAPRFQFCRYSAAEFPPDMIHNLSTHMRPIQESNF